MSDVVNITIEVADTPTIEISAVGPQGAQGTSASSTISTSTPVTGTGLVYGDGSFVTFIGLGTGVSTFLTTPSSANLKAAITDETGSGSLVFATSPTISQPNIDNFRLGYTTTATSGGTLTLTAPSNNQQFFTGTSAHTVVLPVASTMVLGQWFSLENNSTVAVTVNSSGGNLVVSLLPGTSVKVTCILTSGTTAASWDVEFQGFGTVTGTGANVLSASPTFTGTVTAATVSATSVTSTTVLASTSYQIGSGSGPILNTTGTQVRFRNSANSAYANGEMATCYAANVWFGGAALSNVSLYGPSDGVMTIYNAAQNGFSRIQLGGTTSSFPAIKRNTTAINIRLADDSADAPITASNATLSGNLIVTTPQIPASATAAGTAGTIAWDTNFIYVCTATNTWKRVAIATW